MTIALRSTVARWLAAAWLACTGAVLAQSPPPQPADGPGGADYAHARVVSQRFGLGETGYVLFEPADPKPASAPVVAFIHGYLAISPASYLSWIHHLVRRGHIVIYPRYQGLTTDPRRFTANTIAGVREGLAELQRGSHVRPELDKFAITGHSCGGAITADLAARAAQEGLPAPSVVMPVEPGCFFTPSSLAAIPATALLVVVVGEDDDVVGDFQARDIWRQTAHIPPEQRDYLILRTDRHGTPALVADHNAPLASRSPATLDAMDWYGPWKILDALTACAWYGRSCDVGLGGSPAQTGMGVWSDGRPVNPMTSTKSP
jgi:acetyl esterase/lipase